MIVTTEMLREQLKDYSDQLGKIMRMNRNGQLFQITKGMYETEAHTPGYCLAGSIYGPSYLSFDYALSVYKLIPETVHVFTSATFKKKKKKYYKNHFGQYVYQDVPPEVYPYGIGVKEENGYYYQIASPEKALCDKLYIMPPVSSQKEIEELLFEDLRIDVIDFENLNLNDVLQIGELYHCNNLKYLMKHIKRKYVKRIQ